MVADAATTAAGKARRIMPALDHHLDRDLADARGIGNGRARHAGKDQADQDIDLRQATAEAADNRLAEVEQPVADGAFIHDIGGDDEQRHCQDDEAVVDALDDLLGGETQVLPGDRQIDDGGDDHRMRDRRADGGQTEQRDQAKREGRGSYGRTPCHRMIVAAFFRQRGRRAASRQTRSRCGRSPRPRKRIDAEHDVEADAERRALLDLVEGDVVDRRRERREEAGKQSPPPKRCANQRRVRWPTQW